MIDPLHKTVSTNLYHLKQQLYNTLLKAITLE